MPTKCCWVIHGSLTSERKASTSPSSFINHSILLLNRALKRQAPCFYMHFEVRALDRLRTRRRVGSTRRRGNHMHDHSRFQRDINDVTGVSLSLSLSLSLPLTKVTDAQYRKRFRASYNMWYPIALHCPIAVHGPLSGPKDLYRAVDRYSGRSYRSETLEFRFAVAVHSPIAVHGSITVQPEFFQFPRRNMRLVISLSTDFCAFSSFRRETCESTPLSALIFVPFQEQEEVWRGLPGIFVQCAVLFLSFFFFRYHALSFQKEKREGLASDFLVKITAVLLPGFGRAKPAISVATPPPPPAPSAVGLAPSARQ